LDGFDLFGTCLVQVHAAGTQIRELKYFDMMIGQNQDKMEARQAVALLSVSQRRFLVTLPGNCFKHRLLSPFSAGEELCLKLPETLLSQDELCS